MTRNISPLKPDGTFGFSYGENGDFYFDQLYTNAVLAIFTDRRAVDSEVEEEAKRRGFWGDDITGDQSGSKVWQNDGRLTQDTLNRITDFTEKSLQFFVDQKIYKDYLVESVIIDQKITLTVTFFEFNETTKRVDFIL